MDARIAARKRVDFMTEVEPILLLKAKVYNIAMPKMLLYPDGHIETIYEFTDEQQKHLDLCDELIAMIRKRYEPTTLGERG